MTRTGRLVIFGINVRDRRAYFTGPGGGIVSGRAQTQEAQVAKCWPVVRGENAAERIRSAPTGAELTKILTNASPTDGLTLTGGDVIELSAGVVYVGPFTLPVVASASLSAPLKIRTNGYIPGSGGWPISGRRATPAHVSLMAEVRTPVPTGANDQGALTFTTVNNSAYWTIQGVICTAQAAARFDWYAGNVIWFRQDYGIGTYPPADFPHHLTMKHCLVRGDAVYGTGNGISTSGDHILIDDCYFYQMWTAVPFGGTYGTGVVENQCISILAGDDTVVRNTYCEGSMEPTFVGGVAQCPTNILFDKCRNSYPEWMYIWGPTWGTSGSTVSAANGWYAQGTDLVIVSVDSGAGTCVVTSAAYPFTTADVSKAIRTETSTGFTGTSIYTGYGNITAVNGSNQATIRVGDGTSLLGTAGATAGQFRKDVIFGIKNIWEIKDGSGFTCRGCVYGDFYIQGQPNAFAGVQVYDQVPSANVTWEDCFVFKIPHFTSISHYATRRPEGWTFSNVIFADLVGLTRASPYAKFLETTYLKDLHLDDCLVTCEENLVTWFVHYSGSDQTTPGSRIRNCILYATTLGGPQASDWAGPVWLALAATEGGTVDAVITDNVLGGGTLNAVNDVLEDNKWPKKAVSTNNVTMTKTAVKAEMVDPANGNWRLSGSSPLKGTGYLGADPGPDQDAIVAAMSPDDITFVLTHYSGFAG